MSGRQRHERHATFPTKSRTTPYILVVVIIDIRLQMIAFVAFFGPDGIPHTRFRPKRNLILDYYVNLTKNDGPRPTIRGFTLVQNLCRTDFWLCIQRLYQPRNLRTRCASCSATCHNIKSPSSCRQQDDGTHFCWNEELHYSAPIQPN